MKRSLFLLACVFLLFSCGTEKTHELTVATYNIRLDTRSDVEKGNGWTQRCPVIASQVMFYDFDIWGAQEVLHWQLEDLTGALPQYAYIGVGRADGMTGGEYSPIFYKEDMFDVLDSGTFWISEEPEVPGKKGWDAACERICTWGRFREKGSGLVFTMFNLHMDHRGKVARREGAKLVLDRVAQEETNGPMILMGDFNVDQNDESYLLINNSGIVRDSRDKAGMIYALNGTINFFNPNAYTTNRIDHIFVSDSFVVKKYGVLTDTYRTMPADAGTGSHPNFPDEVKFMEAEARTPSDHFPVMIVLEYSGK